MQRPEPLSHRELEALQAMAEGLTSREIARRMNVTESTVKTFLNHVFFKLGTNNRTETVWMALKWGIIDPPKRVDLPASDMAIWRKGWPGIHEEPLV